MTRELNLRSFDIPSIHKFAVGFDGVFDEILRLSNQQKDTNYPPYNIVKHSENKFVIELAVAGFKEGDINVTVDKNLLTIEGSQSVDLDTNVEYLYRGISARNFTRTFTLADHVEVSDAVVNNGIMGITLERQVPDELQPKKIAISYNK
jgi:molecular chaperone IbpA